MMFIIGVNKVIGISNKIGIKLFFFIMTLPQFYFFYTTFFVTNLSNVIFYLILLDEKSYLLVTVPTHKHRAQKWPQLWASFHRTQHQNSCFRRPLLSLCQRQISCFSEAISLHLFTWLLHLSGNIGTNSFAASAHLSPQVQPIMR